MIQASGLVKIYGKNNTETCALNGIDLNVEKGGFVAVCGPSGCGKSTLLNILGCLERPTSGEVFIDGVNVSRLKDDALACIRRDKIGFIFQSYNLIATMSALGNVMLPMLFAGKSEAFVKRCAEELLESVGMQNRMNHKPFELSGGEQQRVAVARALINNPGVIIGDEPTGNLDSKCGEEIMNILLELNREGRTVILVTHDDKVAKAAQRVMTIKDGCFVVAKEDKK